MVPCLLNRDSMSMIDTALTTASLMLRLLIYNTCTRQYYVPIMNTLTRVSVNTLTRVSVNTLTRVSVNTLIRVSIEDIEYLQ